MSKVFVVNFAGHDFTPAEDYGELRFVTRGYVSLGSLDRVLFDVIHGLKDSTPSDWLLPSGWLLLNTLAAAVWLVKHGSLRILVWDKKGNFYKPMEVTEDHMEHILSNLTNGDQRASGTEASQD